MNVDPKCARLSLLKFGFSSAEGQTSVRASVCKGIFFESESRACRAASFADLRARSGFGEGRGPWYIDCVGTLVSSGASRSGTVAASSREDCIDVADWYRAGVKNGEVLGRACAPKELGRAWSNCPLHPAHRNLFIGPVVLKVDAG